MAIVAISVSRIRIGGTEYSGQIAGAVLNLDREALDKTNFDSAGWKEFVGGARSATLDLEWRRDTDLSGLQSALWTAFTSTTGVVTFTYQLVEDTLSATAPEFQGSVLITKDAIGAAVNQLWANSTSWPTTGAIARDVSP